MLDPDERGGVEEKKEDDLYNLSPNSIRNRPHSSETLEDAEDEEQKYGFQAQWRAFAKALFGSCGSAIEAAAFFVQQQTCRWPHESADPPARANNKPPLSIAEELRKLAQREGRPFQPSTRSADIPKFLGEEAVYSFEDDNISALSQHTLEEMARNGRRRVIHHPASVHRRDSSIDNNVNDRESPPSPTRTLSLSHSSSSSKEQQRRRRRQQRNECREV